MLPQRTEAEYVAETYIRQLVGAIVEKVLVTSDRQHCGFVARLKNGQTLKVWLNSDSEGNKSGWLSTEPDIRPALMWFEGDDGRFCLQPGTQSDVERLKAEAKRNGWRLVDSEAASNAALDTGGLPFDHSHKPSRDGLPDPVAAMMDAAFYKRRTSGFNVQFMRDGTRDEASFANAAERDAFVARLRGDGVPFAVSN